MQRSSPTNPAGAILTEALAALALLGLVAAGGASLVHLGVQFHREAERLDRGLLVAETVLVRLSSVSYTRLPEVFSASAGAADARLDSASGSPPADWAALVEGLPDGRITALLEGLGPGGDPVSLGGALALRVRVTVGWTDRTGPRKVELTDVRF